MGPLKILWSFYDLYMTNYTVAREDGGGRPGDPSCTIPLAHSAPFRLIDVLRSELREELPGRRLKIVQNRVVGVSSH